MEFRNLGTSGLRISVVGLGAVKLGQDMPDAVTENIIGTMCDLGVNFIDTADVYGVKGRSEEVLGQLLGARRKDFIIASKFGTPIDNSGMTGGASRRYIMMAAEASLRRLKTDWIDLYQIHAPDPLTPIEETARALDDLVRQGKVRYIGHSKFSGWQTAEAHWVSRHSGLAPFVSSQMEYSLIYRNIESNEVPAIEAYGMGLLPYLPLAGGMLTGRFKRDTPLPREARQSQSARGSTHFRSEADWSIVAALEEFCAKRGHSLLELAVSWLLTRPAVSSVITGATTPEQLKQNVGSMGWSLTSEDLAEIDRITLRK